MASPQQKPDPNQRQPNDLGYTRVERQVSTGRPFAWWWIFALVIIAAIVWWGGWGHSNRRSPTNNANAPAATAPARNGENVTPQSPNGQNNRAANPNPAPAPR